jgi:hypothetical protein
VTGPEDGIPRCPVCRYRELSGPLYLCAACLEHLGADLAEVVKLAGRLDARPAVASLDGRGPPGFRSKPPGRVDVWVARDERSKPHAVVDEWWGRDRDGVEDDLPSHEDDRPIRGVWWTLSSWAGLLHESRGFTHPLPGSVPELAAWIDRQSDYVSRWPDDGPELVRDVRALRNQLRSLTGDPNPRPAAWCIRMVPVTDGPPTTCGAPIFLPRGQTEIDHTQPLRLHCGAPDPHTYSGLDLLKLKLSNEGDHA